MRDVYKLFIIDEIINGGGGDCVIWKKLWEVTKWDKRFSGVDRAKQKETMSFKHVPAAALKDLQCDGNIKLLATGKFDGWTNAAMAKDFINNGEVITIPSGGRAIIKYYNGAFVDGGNILGSSIDGEKYSLKFIYYYLLKENDFIQSAFRGGSVQHPEMKKILDLPIPFPSIAVQREIIRILDKFTTLQAKLEAELQAELEARQRQYEYYRDRLLTFNPPAGSSEQQAANSSAS